MKSKLLGFVLLLALAGCGYTNKVVLPYGEAKTIHVPMFRNAIPPENILTYEPGLEAKVTQAVIDGIVKDGNLRVEDPEDADLVLKGEIVGYEQEPFRFNRFEQTQEFRIFIVVAMELKDAKTGKTYWMEKNFSGDTQYFTQGPRAVPQERATNIAVADLAEKVVNRVVEDW